jgi:hypothetical protein
MGRRRVTVGMDGSLYKFHPHFHDRMVTKVSIQTYNWITLNLLQIQYFKPRVRMLGEILEVLLSLMLRHLIEKPFLIFLKTNE